jgi:hypothetical protein
MEFDILNIILTDTVGSVFNDDIVYGSQGRTPFKMYTPKLIIDGNKKRFKIYSKLVSRGNYIRGYEILNEYLKIKSFSTKLDFF